MKIELRKISHNQRLSEETPAYSAAVYVDGVHICDVANHGQGGCDNQYPASGKTRADVEALDARVKKEMPPIPAEDHGDWQSPEMQVDLELWCHIELGRIADRKALTRALKTKTLFTKTPGGPIYEIRRVDPRLPAILREKDPGAVILNELPFDEALKLFAPTSA